MLCTALQIHSDLLDLLGASVPLRTDFFVYVLLLLGVAAAVLFWHVEISRFCNVKLVVL